MDENIVPVPVAAPAAVISPEKKSFLAALAKAQGSYEQIEKNAAVKMKLKDNAGIIEFKYADLAEILKKTRKALSDNGISVRSLLTGHDGDSVWLNSIVAHADGYEDVSSMMIRTDGDIKLFGQRVTYSRRYLLAPQLGVAGDSDLDDNGLEAGADQTHEVAPGKPPKPTPARRSTAAPAARQQDSGPPDEPPPPEGFSSKPAAPAPQTKPAEPDPFETKANPPATKSTETGELASEGEVAYIVKRAATRGALLRPVLDDLGLHKLGDTKEALFGHLLKSDWERLKTKV